MVDGSWDDDGPALGLPLGMVDGSWEQELHLALHV